MLSGLLFGCVAVLVIIAGIGQSISYTAVQYQLEEARQVLHQELLINEHLQLQVAQLESLTRIEHLAKKDLGMIEPAEVQTIVLAPELPTVSGGNSFLAHDITVTEPNRYVAAATRVLARLISALGQAEAGRIEGK